MNLLNRLFPCQKALASAMSANKDANDRLREACGEGYIVGDQFVPKAKFTEDHLNDRRKKT